MDKQNNTFIYLAAALLSFIMTFLLFWQNDQIKRLKYLIEKSDTTIITNSDTVYNKTIVIQDTLIKEKKSIIKKTDTIITNNNDSILLELKKKDYQDTLITNNNQDTLQYQLSIEGYSMNNDSMPRLTNFKAQWSNKYVTNEKIITVEKISPQKQNKWGLQIGVGTGWGIINKNPDVFIGLSIGYKIF